MHLFTHEQADFIKKHVKGRGNAELLDLVNQNFGLQLKINQIRNYKKNHHLSSGLTGRFKPGHVPTNKGQKGVGGWKPTQFKKGHRPHNYKPIGSERVNSDGYVDIKVAPNKWRALHLLIWEQAHGPVPQGHKVIFGDGDKRNFSLDNLILVSNRQLVVINRKGLLKRDADLTKTGLILADLYNKITLLQRKKIGGEEA